MRPEEAKNISARRKHVFTLSEKKPVFFRSQVINHTNTTKY